jgi:hypothetical protein
MYMFVAGYGDMTAWVSIKYLKGYAKNKHSARGCAGLGGLRV